MEKRVITSVPKDTTNIEIDTIRPITQTNIYSKNMEEFMFHRIYEQIISKLSAAQFFAIKKSPTSYYLVSLYNFVFKALEKPNTYIILVLLDLSKAFDLVDHYVLVRCLIQIRIKQTDVLRIADFLRNRKQCTKHKNLMSEFLSINNSTPQ